MTDEHRYDLLILGGGMSYVGAIRAAQLGMKVAVVERDKMGGTCLNRGCIPSKALLETADLLHRAKELGGEFGLTNTDGIGLDPVNLGKRRDAVVDKHVKGVEFLMKKNKVTVLRGHGVLTSPTSVRISGGESGDLEASATDLILATGSAPRHLPDLTVDQDRIIDSDEALRRDAPPKSVTIIGAGAIGVEWASLYGDLGAEVQLVEFMDRIVPLEDPDVSKELARLFRKRGMAIHAGSTVDPASLQRTKTGIRHAIVANDGGERTEVESDWILVAIGRRPVTENIGLEQIDGVKLDRGFIVVDGNMRTGVPHLYAIGDVVPGYALAHVASHESLVAVETIAGREPEPIRMDLMPRVTFCRPEIASVGLSEAEAIGGRPHGEGRQLPVPRPGQGDDRGRGRRVCEVRGRRRDRTAARGAYHRSPRRRPAGRADLRPPGGGDGRGDRDVRACPPDPDRGPGRGRAGGRRGRAPRLTDDRIRQRPEGGSRDRARVG